MSGTDGSGGMADAPEHGTPYPTDELLTDDAVRTFDETDTAVAFPLGGVGTGNVALGSRGDLRDWEVFNRPSKGTDLPYSFFAVRTETADGESVARVLEAPLQPPHSPPTTSSMGYQPPTTGGLPRLDGARFDGRYPVASVAFEDDALPVEVGLEAYTPLVPLDPEDSGLPVAVLEYTVSNPTDDVVEASLMGSFPNVAGYLADESSGGPGLDALGGNRNAPRSTGSLTGVHYTTDKYESDARRYGEFALGVLTDGESFRKAAWPRSTWWDSYDSAWREFADEGRLAPNAYDDPTADGAYDVGSVGAALSLAPGESETVTFLLSWYVPNRAEGWHVPVADADADGCCGDGGACETEDTVRNHYATRFEGAWDVLDSVATDLDRLRERTYAFRDAFFDSSLPGYVLDAAASNLSVARSPTVLWLEDGTVLGFEGCGERQGCCHGTCTHVWNYAQAMSRVFPSLEREMRRIDFEERTADDGYMSFRVPYPFDDEPLREHAGGLPAADGQFGTVLRLYREWLFSGDDAFLERLWPAARRALEFAFEHDDWDPDADGVMEGAQHHTLDVEFYGPNTATGSWYLAALAAGAEMARAVGDGDAAERDERVLASGRARLDEACWAGDRYVQALDDPDAHRHQYGAGCHVDQVVGQWAADSLGLADVLPPERVETALSTLFRENFLATHEAHANTQRGYAVDDDAGLLICTWDEGDRPEVPVPYHDETMSGFEYAAAAHMISAGLVEEGLTVVKAIRERHDGTKRNPWDEFECGSHYARTMASWAVYEALAGYDVDLTGRTDDVNERGFRFDPVLDRDPFRGFWITDEAWGTYERRGTGDDATEDVEVLYRRDG
jgi:uncharacterized protein (DUF608 family)